MRAYSMDLRRRVLADSDAGLATKPVAEKYGVSRTWVRSLKQRRRETGEIAPRVGGGRKPKIDRQRLVALVAAQPDATLAELRERLGVQCSLSAIWMALDKLKITFNETGTSSIDIQTKNAEQINASNLDIFNIEAEDLDSDANIDKLLADLKTALNDVRSQSSAFGSNLSIVQNRQDFTKNMVNTLETGGANLTLADMNEEAANLLALQTRQSLSSNSLSLASQADQSILQLLR